MPNYKIYPSLLNKFQDFLDAERDAEELWNKTADGDYRIAPAELVTAREKQLIDAVNRVPFVSEAADRGTAFNKLVDLLISVPIAADPCAEVDGFAFSGELAKEVAGMLPMPLAQYYTEAVLHTSMGDVLLYGYPDYWCADNMVVDLKTTGQYEWPKFDRNWQRLVYPWCLTTGSGATVDLFRFLVVKWAKPTKKESYWRGTIYTEDYNYNHAMATQQLKGICEQFIGWLEHNKEKITDKKIFAEL